MSCVTCHKMFVVLNKIQFLLHNLSLFVLYFPLQHGSQEEVCPSDSCRRGDPSSLPGSENTHDPSASSTHSCQSKQTTCAKLCCGSFFSAGLQLPWAKRQLTSSLNHQTPDTCTQGHCTTKSLMELLVSGLCFKKNT